LLMMLSMNGFYGLKALRKNYPADMCAGTPDGISRLGGNHKGGVLPTDAIPHASIPSSSVLAERLPERLLSAFLR
jgi:hypothetical protein